MDSLNEHHVDEISNGILFLGTGVSSGLPQLSHIIPIGKGQNNLHKDFKKFVNLQHYNPVNVPILSLLFDHGKTPDNDQNIFHSDANNQKITDASAEYSISTFQKKFTKLDKNDPNFACLTCLDGLLNPRSKNRRNNISLIIKIKNKNILLDCGKTFRNSAISFFPQNNIDTIDALILSHYHEDAMGGLDDLRDFQECDRVTVGNSKNGPLKSVFADDCDNNKTSYHGFRVNKILPIYLTDETFMTLKRKYNYIVDVSIFKGSKNDYQGNNDGNYYHKFYDEQLKTEVQIMKRQVLKAEFNFIDRNKNYYNSDNFVKFMQDCLYLLHENHEVSADFLRHDKKDEKTNKDNKYERINMDFDRNSSIYEKLSSDFDKIIIPGLEDLEILVLPVLHGHDFVCSAYAFGKNSDKIVIISDVSIIPSFVLYYLSRCLERIGILIIDVIGYNRIHFSHINMHEALRYIDFLKPRKVYFVGMSCGIEHDDGEKFLSKWLQQRKSEDDKCDIEEVRLAYDGLFLPLSNNFI